MENFEFCGAYLSSCPYYRKDKKTGELECLAEKVECNKGDNIVTKIIKDELDKKTVYLNPCPENEEIYCPGSIKRGRSNLFLENGEEIVWMPCVQETPFCAKWIKNYEEIKTQIPDSKIINAKVLKEIILTLK